MKDMRDPTTPNVTREQFINREIVGSTKWIRSQYAGGIEEDEDKFFEVYAVDGNKDGVSIVFTPFIVVDSYGNTSFNNKLVKKDLSEDKKVYYILPDKLEYSSMVAAVFGKAYSSAGLNKEFKTKLGEYLCDDFPLEKHLGILSYTYERDI
jgi:hypothetical protein